MGPDPPRCTPTGFGARAFARRRAMARRRVARQRCPILRAGTGSLHPQTSARQAPRRYPEGDKRNAPAISALLHELCLVQFRVKSHFCYN